jgi:membrane-bound lytic murein transglycosylase B
VNKYSYSVYWLVLLHVCLLMPAKLWSEALDKSAVTDFVQYMVDTHDFEEKYLESKLVGLERSKRVINLMARPAEKSKTWLEYKKIFVTEKRAAQGLDFWKKNYDILTKASEKYGVPPHIIVAIIGIETFYGRIKGDHNVLQTLATLAFHYPGDRPRRKRYFRIQLEELLLLARAEGLDLARMEGSYAGALGIPQFMPDNYRKLSVDFDEDGKRDIWMSSADAIGSVGNYLKHHGWTADAPIIASVRTQDDSIEHLLNKGIKAHVTIGELESEGLHIDHKGSGTSDKVALFRLPISDGFEYWAGYNNFYVISRYNPRTKYVMVVVLLADAIRKLHEKQLKDVIS